MCAFRVESEKTKTPCTDRFVVLHSHKQVRRDPNGGVCMINNRGTYLQNLCTAGYHPEPECFNAIFI